MTQTRNPIDPAQARAEVHADVASKLLMEASQAEGSRRQALVEKAKLHLSALQDWITPEAPEEAHGTLRELTTVLAQFEEAKPN